MKKKHILIGSTVLMEEIKEVESCIEIVLRRLRSLRTVIVSAAKNSFVYFVVKKRP